MRKLCKLIIQLVFPRKNEFNNKPAFINQNGELLVKGNILKENGCIAYNVNAQVLGMVSVYKNDDVTISYKCLIIQSQNDKTEI